MDYLERITNPLTGEISSTLAGAVDACGGVALGVGASFHFTQITTKDGQVFLLLGQVPSSFVSLLVDVYEQDLQVKFGVLTWS